MLNQEKINNEKRRVTKRSDDYYESINPSTEKVIETYPYDTLAGLTEKLQVAHAAFQDWSQVEIEDRITPIEKFGKILKKRKKEFARAMTEEMGKLYNQGLAEIDLCVAICEHAVNEGPEILATEEKTLENGRALVAYEPQGVILSIQPWNFPFYQAIRYAVPNITAGNTTLLSHAPSVWGCARLVEEAFKEAGLPEGVFQLIYAKDDDIEKLYEQREVRGVTFTGSADTGAIVAEKAGKHLKKTVLELGGNDAYIVTESADIKKAVKACTQGRIFNNGQTCTAAKRFIVLEGVFDEFKKAFVKAISETQMGDPMEKTSKLGPIARKDLLDKLNDQVQESLDLGATCLTGGHVAKRDGYFFEPTVLTDLEEGMPAYDDELFGPVASLIKAKDLDEAIEISNNSKYGLGGGIFGSEEEVVEVAKKKLDTGVVNVNGFSLAKPHLPYGGVKDSGYGREHGKSGFKEFVNTKTVMIHQ